MTTHREVYDPNAQPLNPEELKIAIRDNINHHREFVRSHVDPKIPTQEVSAESYQFLETPLILPDGGLLYGWVKHRGGHSSWDIADKHCSQILKFEDSKSKNVISPIGSWVALTSSKNLTQQFHELSDSEFRKNEQCNKEKEAEKIRQIREREETLKAGISEFAEDSLDYYVVQKVSLAENEYTLEQAMKRVKEARKNIDLLTDRIKTLDQKNPEHKKNALSRYNKERNDAGLDEVRAFSHKNR